MIIPLLLLPLPAGLAAGHRGSHTGRSATGLSSFLLLFRKKVLSDTWSPCRHPRCLARWDASGCQAIIVCKDRLDRALISIFHLVRDQYHLPGDSRSLTHAVPIGYSKLYEVGYLKLSPYASISSTAVMCSFTEGGHLSSRAAVRFTHKLRYH